MKFKQVLMKKNILGTYGLQILNVFFSFFMSIAIARILGASERGELVIFITSTSFMSTLMEFCLGTAITYFVAAGKFPIEQTFTTIIYWTFFVLIITTFVIFISPFLNIHQLLFGQKNADLNLKVNFTIITTLSVFNTLLIAFFYAKKLFKLINFLTLGTLILTSLTYLLLWLLGNYKGYKFSAETIVFTTTVILSIKTIVLFLFYTKYIAIKPAPNSLNLLSLKKLFTLSIVIYIANIVQFLSYRMDFWFVNYYSGIKALGIYSLAVNLAQLFWMLPNSVGVVLFPNIASMDSKKALDYTQMLCRIVFSTTILLGIFGGTTLAFLIPYIYGIEFSSATKLFFILLIGILPFSIKIIIASYYGGVNKIKFDMIGSIFGFIICLIFDVILIPKYGSIGAAIATVFAYSANTIFMITSFKIITNSSISSFLVIKKSDIKLIINYFPIRKIFFK